MKGKLSMNGIGFAGIQLYLLFGRTFCCAEIVRNVELWFRPGKQHMDDSQCDRVRAPNIDVTIWLTIYKAHNVV